MKKIFAFLGVFLFVFLLSTQSTLASHSWGNYHWARQSNPFTLKLGDNLSSVWDPYLVTTSSDWSKSNMLDTFIVAGQSRKNCRPTAGRVEACNAKYGNNGWLGMAQIWASGTHITQGLTKVNDTYFSTPTYNTSAWKSLVMCQEVGHTLGLDHQDEDKSNPNLGTCMDYTGSPDSNQHPNQHDYDMLEQIYAHLDSFSTINQSLGQVAREMALGNLDNPGEWGRSIKDNGKVALYERDLGFGNKLFTFVIWTK